MKRLIAALIATVAVGASAPAEAGSTHERLRYAGILCQTSPTISGINCIRADARGYTVAMTAGIVLVMRNSDHRVMFSRPNGG